MILKKRLVFFVTFLCVVSSVSVFAGTVTFQWEDTTSEVPGSTFELTINGEGPNWSATLTVDTINSPGWYINYITLHLDGGTRPDVALTAAPPGFWNAIGTGEVDLLKKRHFPQSSWIGFYTDGIAGGSKDIDEGVLLDGGSATWTFYFELLGGSILNESPSIQVGYFSGWYNGGGKYKVKFTQMSQSVPEPSTLLLLLSGTGFLAGVARFRRKME